MTTPAPCLEEDRPLSAEELRVGSEALACCPSKLRDHAYGDQAELAALVARCVRGETKRVAVALESTLAWRNAHEADTVLSRHLPGAAAFHAAWPGVLCGTDAHGHLVWLEALKDVDVEALSALSYDQLVRHRMQAMEALEAAKRACAPCGRLYRKHIYILDCRGVSPGLFLNGAARRVIKTMSAVCSDYYTETLWRCYLVHTSPAARFMWAALRPLLHPDTAAKVRLCGGPGDFHKAMEKEGLPVSALPPVLGGSFDPAVPLYDNILAAIRDAQRPARAFLRDDSARQLGTHEDELLQSRPLHKGWMTTPQPLTLLRMRA